jgi:hypothetical protein
VFISIEFMLKINFQLQHLFMTIDDHDHDYRPLMPVDNCKKDDICVVLLTATICATFFLIFKKCFGSRSGYASDCRIRNADPYPGGPKRAKMKAKRQPKDRYSN